MADMSATRLMLYTLGSLFVIGGIVMLFFETGLDKWISSGMALAGLIIIVGVAVMGLADKARKDVHVDEHHVDEHHHD